MGKREAIKAEVETSIKLLETDYKNLKKVLPNYLQRSLNTLFNNLNLALNNLKIARERFISAFNLTEEFILNSRGKRRVFDTDLGVKDSALKNPSSSWSLHYKLYHEQVLKQARERMEKAFFNLEMLLQKATTVLLKPIVDRYGSLEDGNEGLINHLNFLREKKRLLLEEEKGLEKEKDELV